jgi:hypothetical protein
MGVCITTEVMSVVSDSEVQVMFATVDGEVQALNISENNQIFVSRRVEKN